MISRTKKYLSTLTFIFFSIVLVRSAFAIPRLQLDIGGGYYDPVTETIMSPPGDSFTVYALLNPGTNPTTAELSALLSETYYLSVAITPKMEKTGEDLGEFSINGDVIDVTSGMTYGSPPIENLEGHDGHDLGKHDIYETYFYEHAFNFNPDNTTTPYNTQLNPGGFSGQVDGELFFYAAFNIDISGLDPEHAVHSDLYNTAVRDGLDVDVDDFAPFSHDAQGGPIPEPSTFLLLGSGLIILRKFRRKHNDKAC
jgi:hypothetical protein